jgi:gluconate 2-dehydrogenase gamma chain
MPLAFTRRDLMFAAACWSTLLRAQEHNHASQAPGSTKLEYFDPATAAEINAIAAQIIPEDETAGAVRAGVIFFIDRSLAGYDQDKRELYARGLAEAQAKRAELFPGSSTIAALSGQQQIALLKAIEKSEFFRMVRFHTILGFFGHPMHGGNRGEVGWKLIGIQHSMSYEPPFGFYDAETARGGAK